MGVLQPGHSVHTCRTTLLTHAGRDSLWVQLHAHTFGSVMFSHQHYENSSKINFRVHISVLGALNRQRFPLKIKSPVILLPPPTEMC